MNVPAMLDSLLPRPRAKVFRLTPRDSRFSHHWMMSTGKAIRLPVPAPARQISPDWDRARLRCWPRISMPCSAAQAEVLVAKAMCTLFAVGIVAITSALSVLA